MFNDINYSLTKNNHLYSAYIHEEIGRNRDKYLLFWAKTFNSMSPVTQQTTQNGCKSVLPHIKNTLRMRSIRTILVVIYLNICGVHR